MSMYEQFMDLKCRADEMGRTPTRWVVGGGVTLSVKKGAEPWTRVNDSYRLEYLGIPMEYDPGLPDGRVTLECGEWHAGAFTLGGEMT